MNISNLEDLIVLHVPDASSMVLQHAIRQAAVRFAREAEVLVDYACLRTQCGVPEYDLPMPDCRRLVSVTGVEVACDGFNLWRDDGDAFNGCRWNMDEYHPIIVLRQAPARDDDRIDVRYVWAPAREECDIPEEFYERWAEAVKHAALADLFSMPKQEWSSPQSVTLHEHYYQVELGAARAKRWHNYSRRPLTIASRPFLGPRR